MDRTESESAGETALGRLPWHKPEVQRLTVSLDTRDGQGSPAGFVRLHVAVQRSPA